jgi:hypothetical protein
MKWVYLCFSRCFRKHGQKRQPCVDREYRLFCKIQNGISLWSINTYHTLIRNLIFGIRNVVTNAGNPVELGRIW